MSRKPNPPAPRRKTPRAGDLKIVIKNPLPENRKVMGWELELLAPHAWKILAKIIEENEAERRAAKAQVKPGKKRRMSSFEKWIEQREWDLLAIRDRLGLLKGIEAALGEQAVKGKVQVVNHDVYRLAMDSYEMLVIDLASFFTGLLQSGPGLNQLNNHLAKLTPGKEPTGVPQTFEEDLEHEKLHHRNRVSAFKSLFPKCEGAKASQSDVQLLKDRLDKLSARCRDLRNRIHAHRYEPRRQDTAAPARLNVSEIEVLFQTSQDILNALRLLVLNSTFGYGPVDDAGDSAIDLREIIIHGSINNFCLKLGVGDGARNNPWYWQRRDRFYASPKWAEERRCWKFSRDDNSG